MSNSSNVISLNITKFPQNLLIPDSENSITIEAINISKKAENFKFDFSGENLNIIVQPDDAKGQVKLNPNETKNIELKLIPTADGLAKLYINIYFLKIVQYTVKVQKVREKVNKSKIDDIFKNKFYDLSSIIKKIDFNEYVISMNNEELKQVEKQLKEMKKTADVRTKDLDKKIKVLAKGHLATNNIQKALELALELSNENEKLNLYYNLIRTYASINFDSAVQLVNGITDLNLKNTLIRFLIVDQISLNPEKSLQMINHIENFLLKIKILFNIAKEFKIKRNDIAMVETMDKILSFLLNQIEKMGTDPEFFTLLKDSIHFIAEIKNPPEADRILQDIKNKPLSEKISKELFQYIYEMVDEIRTKEETDLIYSQLYVLNTYASKIHDNIRKFSSFGGNASSNLLMNESNFNIAFLCLFGFDFSVFPVIDRLYNDIKYSLNKSFAYYILPSKANYNQDELNVLDYSLKQFFSTVINTSGKFFIFNLDFIPYLGKPTIIISSEPESYELINSKIKKVGKDLNLLIDDSVFKGGEIYNKLKDVFAQNKFKVINIVLSYEFISDYDLFKAFIQSLL